MTMNDAKKVAIYPNGEKPGLPPYSPGVVVGSMVFVAGQGSLDPATGEVVGSTIEEQTELTLRNVQRVLEAAGCTMNDCVKVTAHLTDMNDFDRYNAVYRKFFVKPYPARTTVQSVLWSGILVEIDAIALKGSAASKA